MKRSLAIFCMSVLLLLGACHHGHCADKPFRVLATTFPVYQFAANICAGAANVEVELLIPAAAGCPHDFALKHADLTKLSRADAIIINGAGLEEFLTKPLAELHKKPEIIDAGANVPVLEEPGTAHEHENVNPHIFASPATAAMMVANIATKLSVLDTANVAVYNQNATTYTSSLDRISKALKEVGSKAKNRGIALEHDALAYLADNAGLEIVARFENSASAGELAKIQKELIARKPALLAGDSQYPDKLLRTLAQETGIPFAQLDPCASGPEKAPLDYYLTTMQKNLELLEKYFVSR